MATNDRRDLRRRLTRLAATQAGFFTTAQALEIGYSYQAQHYHAHAGNWHRVDRALYRLIEWPPGPQDDLVRWTLWSDGEGVVSHASAMAIHAIGESEAPRVTLTVPEGFSRADDAVVLHHAPLEERDVEHRDGFRLTSVARTIADVAPLIDQDQLVSAIGDVLEDGTVTAGMLRSTSDRVGPYAALAVERALGELSR